jgi:hypothetical protein
MNGRPEAPPPSTTGTAGRAGNPMAGESKPQFGGLTDAELKGCTRVLARRGNLSRSLNGKDAADFLQEAVRRLMDGQRTINPNGSVMDSLVDIGLSLIWSERQRSREESLPDGEIEDRTSGPPEAAALPDLRGALEDLLGILQARRETGRVYRDAHDFVACLVHQIEARESVKPGHIARLTGMGRARAYAAWRKVKAVGRGYFEDPES